METIPLHALPANPSEYIHDIPRDAFAFVKRCAEVWNLQKHRNVCVQTDAVSLSPTERLHACIIYVYVGVINVIAVIK